MRESPRDWRVNLPKIWRLASVYASGTLASQLVMVAALPVLARIYAPDAFGQYAAAIAVVSMVTMVSPLRFDVGLHVPRTTAVAADMHRAAFGGVTVASILVACLAAITLSFRHASGREQVVIWCLLLPALCWLTGVLTISSAWAARSARHKNVAGAQIARSLATVSAQIGVGLAAEWRNSAALLTCTLLGVLIGLIWLRATAGAAPSGALWGRRAWMRSVAAIRRFKEFPRESAPQALLSSASNNVTALLLITFAGAHVAGYFALAERAVRAPILLVSSSLRQAFVQGLAQAERNGIAAGDLARSASARIALVLFVPVIAAFLLAPYVIDRLMGVQWRDAGPVVRWMIPWFFLNALAVPFSASMQVQRRMRGLLILEGALLLAKLLVIPAAALVAGAPAAVFSGAVLPALGSLGTIFIGLRVVGDARGLRRSG